MTPRRWNFLKALSNVTFALIVSCTGFGCGKTGPERSTVSGTVSYGGEPVEQGVIVFTPVDAKSGQAVGGNIVNGKYEIAGGKGPFPGSYLVKIEASRKTGRQVQAGNPAPPGTMIDEVKPFIPAKYNSQTTLNAEIGPGKNSKDFDLAL